MATNTEVFTLEIPKKNLEFARHYASARGLSLDSILLRYIESLGSHAGAPSSTVREITGLAPSGIDAEAEFREAELEKHSR